MSNKILVSGFDPFGLLKKPNSSSEIALPAIKEKYSDLVETVILPTAHNVAAAKLQDIIREVSPLAVVMFGISSGRAVRLEQQAKNRRFSLLIPDNNGVRTFGRIDSRGDAHYQSTLPLDDLYTKLDASKIPVKISENAGAFVCNEVMYKALQHTEGKDIPTGFIHLGNGLSEQLVEEAAVLVVDELIKQSSVN